MNECLGVFCNLMQSGYWISSRENHRVNLWTSELFLFLKLMPVEVDKEDPFGLSMCFSVWKL